MGNFPSEVDLVVFDMDSVTDELKKEMVNLFLIFGVY